MSVISATRERLPGEIVPVSSETSQTWNNDEAKFGGARAYDLQLGTLSGIASGTDIFRPWLKANLDKVHCVHQAIWMQGARGEITTLYTWTCNSNDCNVCSLGVGDSPCSYYQLTTSVERTSSDGLTPIANCKYGDTVKLVRTHDSNSLMIYEFAIIGKPGEIKY